jgi:hypothetical protein
MLRGPNVECLAVREICVMWKLSRGLRLVAWPRSFSIPISLRGCHMQRHSCACGWRRPTFNRDRFPRCRHRNHRGTHHHWLRIESAVGARGATLNRTFDATVSGSGDRCTPIETNSARVQIGARRDADV